MKIRRQISLWLLVPLAAVFVADFQSLLGAISRTEDNLLWFVPGYAVGDHGWPPRWNPHLLAGTPHAGNPQFSRWYPPRWIFAFADVLTVYGFYCFLHFIVAAGAMFAGLRMLGCGGAAAAIGALSFACGSYIQGRLSNPGLLISLVWLPLVPAFAARAATWPRLRWPMLLGVLMALIVMAGSPLTLFYAALIVGMVGLWQAAIGGLAEDQPRPRKQRLARAAGHLAIAAAIAIGLSAVQILPTVEYVRLTFRQSLPLAELARDPLAWSQLPNLFVGTPGGMFGEYLDKSTYFGLTLLPLVALALIAPLRPRREWFFAALAIVGVWIALGTQAGAFHLFAKIPGLDTLSGPSRALVLFALAASSLAAFGVDSLLQREGWARNRRFHIVFGACAILAIALLAWKARLLSDRELRRIVLDAVSPTAPSVFLAINAAFFITFGLAIMAARVWARLPKTAFVAILATVLFIDLLHFSRRLPLNMMNPASLAPPETLDVIRGDKEGPFRVAGYEPTRMHPGDVTNANLRGFLMPNLAALYGLHDIQGFDPLIARDHLRLVEATAGRSPIDDRARMLNIARPDPLLLRLLNVRYVIGDVRERLIARPASADPVQTIRLDEPTTIAGVSFVTLLDNAQDLAASATAAVVIARNETTSRSAPLRAGVETADYRAADPRFPCAHDPASKNMAWEVSTPRGPVRVANYYGRVQFDSPLFAREIELRAGPNVVLYAGTVAAVLPESPQWEKVYEKGRLRVYKNKDAPRGAWIVHRWRKAADDAEALALVTGGDIDLTSEAVVFEDPSPRFDFRPSKTRRDQARIMTYDPDHIYAYVQAKAPGILCFSERFHPGWRVILNDKPGEIIRVNYALRGVVLPRSGNYRVELDYRPDSLLFGKIISLSTLALLALLLLAAPALSSRLRF